MTSAFSQLIILFSFMFCGALIGRLKHISIEKSNILSILLVNVLLPSKIFLNFSKQCTLPYLKTNYPTLLISTGILLLLVLFSLLLSRLLTKNTYERQVYRYSFAISNYAYLGYVFVEAVLGEQALTDMILFCSPFAFYTYSFGYTLLTAKTGGFKRLVNPMVISLTLGILFGIFGIALPSFLVTAFNYASECVGPISMILTGIVIASFSWRDLLPNTKTVIFSLIRLIVIPAFLWLICMCLGKFKILPTAVFPAAVIMGCMPCGLNTVVFPLLVGEDCRMGARFILLSHVLCMLTLPLWLWILL